MGATLSLPSRIFRGSDLQKYSNEELEAFSVDTGMGAPLAELPVSISPQNGSSFRASEGEPSHWRKKGAAISSSASLPVSVPSPTKEIQRAYSEAAEAIQEEVNGHEAQAPARSLAQQNIRICELTMKSNMLSVKAAQCIKEVILYCKQRRPDFELDRPPLRLLALALSQMTLPQPLTGLHVSIRKVAHNSKVYWSSPVGAEFIVCVASDGPQSTQTCIIDPSFLDNFQVTHMTERYAEVLKCLPACFIGSPSSLVPLLKLIVYELNLTFKAHKVDLPPWRSFASLSSKWLSDSCSDESITATAFLNAALKSKSQEQPSTNRTEGSSSAPQLMLRAKSEDVRPGNRRDENVPAVSDISFSAISISSGDSTSFDCQAHLTIGFHIKQQPT